MSVYYDFITICNACKNPNWKFQNSKSWIRAKFGFRILKIQTSKLWKSRISSITSENSTNFFLIRHPIKGAEKIGDDSNFSVRSAIIVYTYWM